MPLVVNRFVLDPARGVLIGSDGQEISLRPKTFALFHHLILNAGRVVNRAELLDTIWPGVYVSDDSITQCIREIRRAVGPEGARLLRTIPKRGYILDIPEPPLSPEAASPPSPHSVEQPRTSDRGPLPTRRRLLAQIAIVASLVIVVGVTLSFWPGRSKGRPEFATAASQPLTPQQEEARRLCQEGRVVFNGHVQPDGWLAARALQERAMAADPSFPNAYAEAAFTYTNMVSSGQSADPAADLAKAEALAHSALALGPDVAVAHFALAAVRRNQRRPAEALVSYQKVVALDPDSVPALASVGYMLVLIGRPAEGLKPIESAIAARPDSVTIRQWQFSLGVAKLLAHVDDMGVQAFRRSLDRPDYAYVPVDVRRLYLAASLATGGDVDAARQVASDVLRDDPTLTLNWFHDHPLSDDPAFKQRSEILYEGLKRAGVPD